MKEDRATPRAVLASIPGWSKRPATIAELSGGLSNRSYRVDSGGRSYVLRLADTDHLKFRDHDVELRIQQLAAARNLAAPVLYADPSSGLMLSEFIPGRALAHADLRNTGTLSDIGSLLRGVHMLPRTGRRFVPPDVIERYFEVLSARGPVAPFAQRCVVIARRLPPLEHYACCHNDIVSANIISGDGLRLIDWEYASDNEPMFDLASLVGWHDLDERGVDALLAGYAGSGSGELRDRLALQRRIYDLVQWMWVAHWQLLRPGHRLGDRLERIQARIERQDADAG